jgi:hypothetical protein
MRQMPLNSSCFIAFLGDGGQNKGCKDKRPFQNSKTAIANFITPPTPVARTFRHRPEGCGNPSGLQVVIK